MDTSRCRGCRDDFYNGQGAAECWHRKTAELVTRYRIHRDSYPDSPGAFTKVEVYACRSEPPWFFYRALPAFVKPEHVRKP